MKLHYSVAIFALASAVTRGVFATSEVHLPIPKEMTRADLYVEETARSPRAILILCPGVNGNGKYLLSQSWVSFARMHQLALVGLSFASPINDLGNKRGYYYPSRGSGDTLVEGLRSIYGRDLPILLYGMSGGAHFTSRFVEWRPERIMSWCAYTAAWWDQPKAASISPPGIVACGDRDTRYGASLTYFLEGRAVGKPWTWVSLSRTGHRQSPDLDKFVQMYFAALLDRKMIAPQWRDIDLKCTMTSESAVASPTLACWLPGDQVAQNWSQIHHP